MTSKFLPFKAEHIELMDLREGQGCVTPDIFKALEGGISFTHLYDGRITGAAGIMELWEGVAELWMLTTIYFDEYPIACCKEIRKIVDMYAGNFKRLQANVQASDERAIRFIEWLGFESEGIMQKYGVNGADHIRYARVL
jgi:hypothetical protein